MTGLLRDLLVPGSPEWQRSMSASKVPAVLGLSPWESRFSVWHRMAGTIGPVDETDEMRRGHYLEPAIAAWFADQHPEWTVETTGTWTQHDRPWQTASPDRLVSKPNDNLALLECKSDAYGDGWGEPLTDEVPPHVRAQCVWQMDTTACTVCHVAMIDGSLAFAEYVVTYDADEADFIRAQVVDFLGTLDRNERPDIDAHGATYQAIREMHPDIDPEEVVLGNDIARSYIAAKAMEKAAKAAAQEATSRVADAMGSAQRATWDGLTVARRQAKNGGTPYVVAARDLPDITKEHAA